MIELKGQIRPVRLYGVINVTPSDGSSGGPLQAKTVYPSHDEQIIAPDEDYYGLVSVTVKPVPRLPFAAVSVKEGGPDPDVDIIINLCISVTVTAEDYVA